ncbi:alpha/beta fold hydrolase [Frigoribacterium sp. 2-23]|uniref:alpha/beta hydrolase n=1 Tax=Frigoribacterium sp. 2-23 TaxID=3415006 RepID=UPI003C6EB188
MPTATIRPTLFCLHALGMSRDEFALVSTELADEFDVVALDLPGFGEASTADGVTIDDTVRGVTRRIRDHGATRWLLVGHSMGGKIASIVAARTLAGRGGLFGLAGVVLLAASPPSPEPMDDERRQTMIDWAAPGRLDHAAARDFVDGNVGAPLPEALDGQAVADVQRSSAEAWTAWLERSSREDWSAEVGTLDLPALIVAGGADGDLGPDAQRELNGRVYPRAHHLVLDGAGHLLPLERPAEVVTALRRFWHDDAGRSPEIAADFSRTIASSRTASNTRGIMARRAVADDPRYTPRALTAAQLDTLRVIADRVVPQDDPEHAIDLAARVDAQLAAGVGDGWRNADLPPDAEAYARGLDQLADFGSLTDAQRDERLTAIVAGEYSGGAAAVDDAGGAADGAAGAAADVATGGGAAASTDQEARRLTPAQLTAWFEDCRVDLVKQWLAHPSTMQRIGFDGFANGRAGRGLQGFTRFGAGQREGWEPAMEVTR